MSLYSQFQAEQKTKSISDLSGATKIGGLYQQYQQEKNKVPEAPVEQQNFLQKAGKAVKDFFIPPTTYAPTLQGQVDAINNPAPDTSIIAPLRAGIKGTIEGWQNTPVAPKDLSGGTVWPAFNEAVTKGFENLDKQVAVLKDKQTSGLQKTAALGEVAVGSFGAMFGALTSPLQGYSTIPVLGNVVDVINKLFSATGEGSKAYYVNVLKQAKNDGLISQSTVDTLTPVVGDTASLLGQLALGKVAGDVGKVGKDTYIRLADNSKAIMTELQNDPVIQQKVAEVTRPPVSVPVKSFDTGTNKVPISTPKSLYAEYRKSQGYEPYVPENQLPTIDYGKTAKPSESVIQTEPKASEMIPKGTKLVPETQVPIIPAVEPTPQAVPRTEAIPPVVSAEVPVKSPIQIAPTFAPIETPIPVGTSKIGKDIEAKAIEARITQGFRETAQYDSTTVAEQARLTADVINTGIDNTRAIIRGETALPERVNPSSFILGVEEYLSKNPSADIAYELANSPLVSETSVAAQTMRFARERNPNSASARLAELKKSRTEKVARTTKTTESDVVKTLKKEMSSMNLTKAELSWEKFINEIVC